MSRKITVTSSADKPRRPRKPKATKPPVPTEHQEQKVLFQLAKMFGGRLPELELLYAVPNGAKLPYTFNAMGKRISKQAGILKQEGLKAGVLDLQLPVARQGFHGLYIELKRSDHSNHPTPEQLWWIGRLRAEGYRCEVCYGCDAAWTVIQDYLGVQITQ